MGKVKKQGKKAEDDEILGVTRSGMVITEKVAEEMAEEFEKNPPDLSQWKRRYVGRPSLGPAGHSPRVSFRVPPDLYKAAWARADKEGRSLSDLAREAFNRYMDS
ncbi:MAG TPA: ribbon-helix-helix domain-containing protein [Solirubrobacterales bacterium]|nr:ribbon-helix-helix domain-containing protein [Solirubrobacterales bacterium]